MNLNVQKIVIWWRVILIACALGGISFLVWKNMAPSGIVRAQWDLCKEDDGKFYGFYPEGRARLHNEDQKNCFFEIEYEPAYFKTKLLRKFNKATVTVHYESGYGFLNIALMRKPRYVGDWSFAVKPIKNKILDELNWSFIQEGSVRLWQKNDKTQWVSLNDFGKYLYAVTTSDTFTFNYNPFSIVRQYGVNPPMTFRTWDGISPIGDDISYILADYATVLQTEREDKVEIRKALFPITPEFMQGNILEFMISAPNMSSSGQTIKVKGIEIEFERESIKTPKEFLQKLKKYIQRIVSDEKPYKK
ncbi:MAG: hypothetical protein HYW78_02595 [Parcubacteria group bacterium]|nr:hypothetical protein [Parcubacteria group bacterium]